MNVKFSKAFLMSGKDFILTPSITLHHPSVNDILSINHSHSPDLMYWMYVQVLLADPYENMVLLDDMGKNYLEVSPYDVFILQWDKCAEDYENNRNIYDSYGTNPLDPIIKALQFFVGGNHEFVKGIYEDHSICFYDKNNESCQINEEIFQWIYEWVKSVNKIDYSGRIKPADENARLVLIEDMRDEMKKRKRRKKAEEDNMDHLGNMMSAVSFCGNGSITPFNINKCKLYWLNESLAINNKRNYAEHILDGIYHGTIRSQDINKKELDWIQ